MCTSFYLLDMVKGMHNNASMYMNHHSLGARIWQSLFFYFIMQTCPCIVADTILPKPKTKSKKLNTHTMIMKPLLSKQLWCIWLTKKQSNSTKDIIPECNLILRIKNKLLKLPLESKHSTSLIQNDLKIFSKTTIDSLYLSYTLFC